MKQKRAMLPGENTPLLQSDAGVSHEQQLLSSEFDSPPPYSSIIASPSWNTRQDDIPADGSNLGEIRTQKRSGWCSTMLFSSCRCYLLIFVFAILSAVIINLAIILPHVEDYVTKSVEVKVKDIDFAGIGKGFRSVKANAKLDTVFDYTRLENSYLKNVFKVGGAVFNSVDLILDDVSIRLLDEKDANEEGKEKSIIDLGHFEIPPFNLFIKNQQITSLDLLVTLKPNVKELYRFLQKLLEKMNNGEASIVFEVFVHTTFKVKLGIIPINRKFNVDYTNKIDLVNQLSLLEKFWKNIFDAADESDKAGQDQTISNAVDFSGQLLKLVNKVPLSKLLSLIA